MNPRIRIVVALIWLTLLTGCNKPADPPRPAMPGATVDADSITFPKDSPQLATLRMSGAARPWPSCHRPNSASRRPMPVAPKPNFASPNATWLEPANCMKPA